MTQDFNLIVTTQRGNERSCIKEFSRLTRMVSEGGLQMRRTRFPGLITGRFEGDPVELCRRIREAVIEDPWSVRFVQKAIPLALTVEASISAIKEAVASISGGIGAGESFRISVTKRGSGLSSREVISEAAGCIDRRVDLERPDRIIQIEIVDETAGIALLGPDDILSVTRMQQDAMEGEGQPQQQ